MIKDLKEFQHLLKLCRKYGVTEVDFGACKVKIGDLPREREEDDGDIPTEELTPEQLMFFSAPPGG